MLCSRACMALSVVWELRYSCAHVSTLFWFLIHFHYLIWCLQNEGCMLLQALGWFTTKLAWTLKYVCRFTKPTSYLPKRQGNWGQWVNLRHNFWLPFWVLTSPRKLEWRGSGNIFDNGKEEVRVASSVSLRLVLIWNTRSQRWSSGERIKSSPPFLPHFMSS